jgi:hypothetical protein
VKTEVCVVNDNRIILNDNGINILSEIKRDKTQ